MKVLFLTRLYSPHIGGVEKHVEEISRVLSRSHQIKILTEKYDPSLRDYEKIAGIEVHRIATGGKLATWKRMRENKYLLDWADLIHVHDVYYWLLPYKLRHLRKKIYITFHGYEGIGPPSTIQIFWHKTAEYLSAGNICIGDFHKKWYYVNPDLVSYGAV